MCDSCTCSCEAPVAWVLFSRLQSFFAREIQLHFPFVYTIYFYTCTAAVQWSLWPDIHRYQRSYTSVSSFRKLIKTVVRSHIVYSLKPLIVTPWWRAHFVPFLVRLVLNWYIRVQYSQHIAWIFRTSSFRSRFPSILVLSRSKRSGVENLSPSLYLNYLLHNCSISSRECRQS